MKEYQKSKKKVGLALGSGGFKGFAHIGVLRILEENKIPIDFIAGSSAGAIMGALYAYIKDIERVEQITNFKDWREVISLVDLTLGGGLIKGDKIRKMFDTIFDGKGFGELKIPFTAVATDFHSGEKTEINKGSISSAIFKSMSVPFMFKMDEDFCDGGASSPVPIRTVKKMGADIVIAVRLEDKPEKNNKKDPYNIALKTIEILQHNLANEELKEADVVIDPYFENIGLVGIGRFLEGKKNDVIKEGERATIEELAKIKKLL